MNYLQKKKLAFMSIVNSVKGFIRTVFGVPPLTLSDCVDTDSIINYSIEGNSVQDGTPTPEAPVAVESVGEYDEESGQYKIPIVCGGKNIVGDYTYTDRSTQYQGVITAKTEFTLKQGVTYTISFDTPNTNKKVYYLHYAKTKQDFVEVFLNGKRKSLTITPTEDITSKAIINVSSALAEGNSTGLCSNCMIEVGTTATEYEPYLEPVTTNIYLDEPLRKIGDYADYIDFENQRVIRNISETVLNGTEGCGIAGANAQNERISYSHSIFGCKASTPSICTHTQTTTDANVGWNGTKFVIQVAATDVRFYRPFYCEIAEFIEKSPFGWKQYLKSLYESGNPYKVYCVRAEQEETPITIPKLPTIKGTTVYTIGTTTQPTNMSATYYATSKE